MKLRTSRFKATVQFEIEGNGQNEIEVKHFKNLKIPPKKYCDISYTKRNFETEKFHRKWI